ncbi:alpha/beta hydrolase [Virgibacillus halophilus]|uniref:Alpha/beta hydrolase n=1 Tax=Tigheibacillus halophilus TaxID=361280 RepID=A0ABU5C6D3_9BACI|nr:alpha/beta hydrolase [Virgibacillus halophilus]
MTLDPQVKHLLAQMKAAGTPPLESFPPELAREAFRKMNQEQSEPAAEVQRVQEGAIPGQAGEIPFRAYYPEGKAPYPVLVFFHGGGWVIGNLDSHDDICRTLANAANCAVIAIDYRLAPENKFPAAVEDCYTAVKYIQENAGEFHIDPSRIAVGGDSAGGNLTAVVSQLAKKSRDA